MFNLFLLGSLTSRRKGRRPQAFLLGCGESPGHKWII